MRVSPGEVFLVPLPIAQGGQKLRPALAIAELPGSFHDVLACGISTRLNHYLSDWDEIVETTDEDFATSGLKHRSLIRLSHLHSVSPTEIAGSIGNISIERLNRLRQRLAQFIHS